MRLLVPAAALLGGLVACAPLVPLRPTATDVPTRAVAVAPDIVTDSLAGTLVAGDRVAWIVLSAPKGAVAISGVSEFEVREQGGQQRLVSGRGGEQWRVERRGRTLRVAGSSADATPWRTGPLVVRPMGPRSLVLHEGRAYRGELWISATESGLQVVNRLPVEDYLRGVVPLELGTRSAGDAAALQAQAIAARSYTYMRVPSTERVPTTGYHMTATVQHQVYGGVAAEHAVVDAAIAATTGLVLRYNGRVVDGPYSSSCGGRTATPTEAWSGPGESGYLQSVSDIDPQTGHAYCDLSPRNAWEMRLNEPLLRQAIVRHLGARGSSGSTAPNISSIAVGARSVSGRVATLVLQTDRGAVTIAGRDIRSALQDARGAILYSTYFEVESASHVSGRVSGVVLRGVGNGHGVGMCQWGAIGRARAGFDARSILRHYYPGTVVGFAE